MKKQLLIILLISVLSINTQSQTLISYEKIQEQSLIELLAKYVFFMETGVEHFRVTYLTTDLNGIQDTASGLFSLPLDRSFSYPVVIHQHGTVAGREDVPSNLQGGYQIGEIFAGTNKVVISPDYLGLGTSKGQHPYVHADSEAWVAIDMLEALHDFADLEGLYLNDQIFITGYSQGGHASMAVHRELESNYSKTHTVAAAAHLSGPYSISEKMIDFTLGDTEYFFVAYLANVALSMKAAYPDLLEDFELDDIFKASYIPSMREFENENIDLFELNDILIDMLQVNVGGSFPKEMLKPEILEALKNEPAHPLSMALSDNDVYDWAPVAPTRIFYCEADDQVFYENGVLAGETMIANGAVDLEHESVGATFDHGGCATPAIFNSVVFFNQFSQTSSSYDEELEKDYKIFSTIGMDELLLYKSTDRSTGDRYRIIDLNGNTLYRDKVHEIENYIDISSFSKGHYIIIIEDTNEILRFFKG